MQTLHTRRVYTVMLAFTPLLWVQVVAVVLLVRTLKVQGPLHVWPVTLVHTLSRLGPPLEASIILLLELRTAFRVQEALGLLLCLQAPALAVHRVLFLLQMVPLW